MNEIFDSEFLKKLQQLVLHTKIVLSDGASGNRKSRSKGSSVEFSDYREYVPGDDFRRVDWNAYGRFEKLFIKLFNEEREASINIFVDTSSSMDWGDPRKNIAALRLAAALGYISLAGYDRVSLYCINDKVEKSRLSLRGKNSLGEMLEFLKTARRDGMTDLYGAISKSGIKGRGISIIISDLLPPTALADSIKLLQYRKQEVFICHILSPQEMDPQLSSNLRLVDSETGEFRDITLSPRLISSYKKVYSDFIAGIEEVCSKWGVHYTLLDSSMPIEQMARRVVSTP